MKTITASGDNTGDSVVVVEERTIVEKVIGSALDPLTMDDNQVAEKRDVQYVAGFYTVLGVAAGSMLARKRQAAGKAPIAKVFG